MTEWVAKAWQETLRATDTEKAFVTHGYMFNAVGDFTPSIRGTDYAFDMDKAMIPDVSIDPPPVAAAAAAAPKLLRQALLFGAAPPRR